jgi:diguanylate cyclase (GGDEF)-like protein
MIARLKQLFAKSADPYAGADIELARRMAAILCVLGALLTLILWPLSPLDREIGDAGWLIGAGIVIWGAGIAVTLRSRSFTWTFERFLVCAYLGVATIAVMQWLAGGAEAPYKNLLLLPLVFVSATNPPRRVAPLLLVIAATLAAPLAYNGWNGDAAAGIIATIVLWTALSFVIVTVMTGIRAQRLALRHGEARAREEARIDELTEIGNRRAFDEALADEVARAERTGVDLTVAMADIVNFKLINDEFGHLEGDKVLREVALAMAKELRLPDRVFRWGGDEFALILPGTDEAGAGQLGERLRNKVAAVCRRPDSRQIQIRFGVAERDEDMRREALLEAADLALLGERTRG